MEKMLLIFLTLLSFSKVKADDDGEWLMEQPIYKRPGETFQLVYRSNVDLTLCSFNTPDETPLQIDIKLGNSSISHDTNPPNKRPSEWTWKWYGTDTKKHCGIQINRANIADSGMWTAKIVTTSQLEKYVNVTIVDAPNQGTDCQFDEVCSDQGSPGDLTMYGAPSADACYIACKAANVITADSCKFWTYYEELGIKTFVGENGTQLDGVEKKTKAAGQAVCRRLLDCDTTFPMSKYCGESMGKQKCASGPGSCEPCDKCDPLVWGSGTATSHWTCDIYMPYRMTNMPPSSICRTECPSSQWSDGINPGSVDSPVKVTATCTPDCIDTPAGPGKWVITPDTAIVNGDGPPNDKPTPTIDAPCLCENIVLGANQLPNAIEEKGAQFYCNEALKEDSLTGVLNTMDYTSRCQLYCNNHLAMDIKCMGGYWSEGVKSNEDIYCWGPPLDCDYTTGVNMDVCTCTDGAANTNICLPEVQACNNGLCQDICVQSDTPIVSDGDCFCESKTGGILCVAASTCNDWTCTAP